MTRDIKGNIVQDNIDHNPKCENEFNFNPELHYCRVLNEPETIKGIDHEPGTIIYYNRESNEPIAYREAITFYEELM